MRCRAAIARTAITLAAGVAAAGGLASCGDPPRDIPLPDEEAEAAAQRARAAALPDAFLIRFEQVTGTGFSRESWEIEVLQMGGAIRVRGNMRIGASSVPIYRPMDAAEFEEFWAWIRTFPLDGYRVQEDPAAGPQEWRKRLKYDVVLGPDDRILSENEWSRPLLEAPWVQAIEDRLHLMVLDLAESELDHPVTEDSAAGNASLGVQRALRALGDAEPTNLPGGSPDAE